MWTQGPHLLRDREGARLACGEEMPSDRDVVLVRFVLVQLTLPLNPFDLHLQDDNGAKHGLPFSGLHRLQVPRRLRQESRFERIEELVSMLAVIFDTQPSNGSRYMNGLIQPSRNLD